MTAKIIQLDPFLKFVEGGLHLFLKPADIHTINQARDDRYQLAMSQQLLEQLRYQALVGPYSYCRLSFSLCTHYRSQALLKSLITPSGEIVNQVAAPCLAQPQLYEQIGPIHWWVWQEVIRLLPWQDLRVIPWLAWLVAIAIFAMVLGLAMAKTIPWPWVAFAIPALWPGQKLFQYLLAPLSSPVNRWVTQSFIYLSSYPWARPLHQFFLRYLVT